MTGAGVKAAAGAFSGEESRAGSSRCLLWGGVQSGEQQNDGRGSAGPCDALARWLRLLGPGSVRETGVFGAF